MSCTIWHLTKETYIELSVTNRELYFFNRYTGETAAVKLSDDGSQLVRLLKQNECDETTLNQLIVDSETVVHLLHVRKLIEKSE